MSERVELEDMVKRSEAQISERERFDRAATAAAVPSKSLGKMLLDEFAPQIEKMAAADRIRQQIKASETARLNRDRSVPKDPLELPSVATGKYRDQQKEARLRRIAEEVSVVAAKKRQRERDDALARKNARHEGPITPTPERLAKAAQGMAVGAAVKSHQTKTVLNTYGRVIDPELVAAGTQLICDWLTAEAGPRVTGSYEGTPAGVSGARHGGVNDYVRECQSTVSLMRAEWHPQFVRVVEWFLAVTVLKPDGSEHKLEDMGRTISPWTPVEKHQGIGFGLFYATLALAARFYGRQRALGRQKTPPTPAEVKALLNAGAARLQERRESYQRQVDADERRRGMRGGR
jgi:hypothetical protein